MGGQAMLSLLCLVFFMSAASAASTPHEGTADAAVSAGGVSDAPAAGDDGRPVTAWAASVRAALARRSHSIAVAGRSALAWSEQGVASWYGHMRRPRRHVVGRTSSGSTFDPKALTAAHPTLPMGTKLLVRSQETGRSVVVTVNDRGPFHGSRIIDLSPAAAARLGMLSAGTAHVVVQSASAVEVAQAEAADSSADAIAAAGPSAERRAPVAPRHR